MIFLKTYENFKTGLINIITDGSEHVFYIENKNGIYLMEDDNVYQRLDIEVPDSSKLIKNEFFMNPEVDVKIISELINQSFIEKTNKKSIAGDREVESYIL